jgi:Cu(I)/Ag(I) efflux system membrane fusion protein
MNTPILRRAAIGAIIVAIAGAGIWATTRGETSATAAAAQTQAATDMSGMTMSDGSVHIDPDMARSLGVTVVAAELAPLARSIRTTGVVVYDETRLTTIAPKFSGFVEKLHVNFTGQAVRRGQPLLEIYSPEMVGAQEELLGALRMHEQLRESASPAVVDRAENLVDAARRRLLLQDIAPAQVAEIERTRTVRRTLTLHAPFGGFVTEMMVQAGQAVDMGMPLYRLADLSAVWVEADVYEQDLRFIALGETVQVEISAWPREPFRGRVSYIYPEVQADTRTTKVRIELANPAGRIKPGMYATVSIDAPVTERAVVVPRDAVMHSGTHSMVFVEEAPGIYRVREVTVGADAGGRTQILAGLIAGERVVNRANFLLDSESRLMESMGPMPGMEH